MLTTVAQGSTNIVAEHGVIISVEAVDTNSLHSALQAMEILFG